MESRETQKGARRARAEKCRTEWFARMQFPQRQLWFFENYVEEKLAKFDAQSRTEECYIIPTAADSTSDVIQVQQWVYITGGGGQLSVGRANTHRFDATSTNPCLEAKALMVWPKFSHNTTNLMNFYIYSVGGKRTGTALAICEVYNIAQDRWRVLASVNEKKHCVGMTTFNDRWLYVFGGWLDAES